MAPQGNLVCPKAGREIILWIALKTLAALPE
jgi:hypothetical protein